MKKKPAGDGPAPIVRQWDRMTELLHLCILTGIVRDARPVSMLLISGPGTGKTELIERFVLNTSLSYQSDITWRGLIPILKQAKRGRVTHLVCTEFQKVFMRKAATADNMIGTLIQAMEEGVGNVSVHSLQQFDGARLGLLGAITHGTLEKKRTYLEEMGFLSRAFLVPWEPPLDEIKEVMRRIRHGDDSDLEPIVIPQLVTNGKPPTKPLSVKNIPVKIGEVIEAFVWSRYKAQSLRPLKRFRTLAVASAMRRGEATVTLGSWEHVAQFTDFWDNVVME